MQGLLLLVFLLTTEYWLLTTLLPSRLLLRRHALAVFLSRLLRPGFGAELVPEPADGLDPFAALAELLADRGDVDVDRAVEDRGVAAEGAVDDLVAAAHL